MLRFLPHTGNKEIAIRLCHKIEESEKAGRCWESNPGHMARNDALASGHTVINATI